MSHRTALLLGALVLAPALVAAQSARPLPLKRRPQPTTAAITENDLMSRLYVFADDSMMGREAGTPGAMKGTAYIAAEVKRLGLTPAGDNGSYFQNVPFIARTLDSSGRRSWPTRISSSYRSGARSRAPSTGRR